MPMINGGLKTAAVIIGLLGMSGLPAESQNLASRSDDPTDPLINQGVKAEAIGQEVMVSTQTPAVSEEDDPDLVAIGGTVKALGDIWKRYGTLPWEHYFEPAERGRERHRRRGTACHVWQQPQCDRRCGRQLDHEPAQWTRGDAGVLRRRDRSERKHRPLRHHGASPTFAGSIAGIDRPTGGQAMAGPGHAGSFQIVWRDETTGRLHGVSDPRRLGYAEGY